MDYLQDTRKVEAMIASTLKPTTRRRGRLQAKGRARSAAGATWGQNRPIRHILLSHWVMLVGIRNLKEIAMDARIDFYGNAVVRSFTKHINAAGAVITGSTLPVVTQELVKIRASQINGCAGCLDMHTKDAEQRGETSVRINLVAAWREATVFTESERAALEVAELGTRVADGGGVNDEAWANAAKHFNEDQLGALVCLIALINLYNRLNVITRQPAGAYTPGQWG